MMRDARVLAMFALLASAAAAPAQTPSPAPSTRPAAPGHAPDSGRVLFERVLGGDSDQAVTADLRRGAWYRLDVRPARADISVRLRVRAGDPPPPLETPALRLDSIPGWRSWVVVARAAGTHVAELTNPGIGATVVRLSALFRAPGDTLPFNQQRALVWSEIVGGGPSFVTLDSGVVYEVDKDVSISPRMLSGAPLRFVPLSFHGNEGMAFMAPLPGEYRVDVGSGTTVAVRIWQLEIDQVGAACVRRPDGPGCRSHSGFSARGLVFGLLAIPVIVVLEQIFR